MKLYDGGSPLRVAREDWSRAGMLVANDAGWRNWLAGRKQNLDAWMAVPRDSADYLLGDVIQLRAYIGNTPYSWTPDTPEPANVTPAQQAEHSSWVSSTRTHNISRIPEAARMCRISGELKYCDWAKAQLLFYAANYRLWPLQQWNGKSRMLPQSLSEATALIDMAEGVRLLGARIAPEQRKALYEGLFSPVVLNLQDFEQGVNNIAFWHAVAIAITALEYSDDAMLDRALNGRNGVNELLARGLTTDYLWFEGSFAYNNYVIAAAVPLFVSASLKGRQASVQQPMLLMQNMLFAPLPFRFDDGYLPTVGDTRGRTRAVDLGAYLSAVRVFPTVIGLIEAKRVRNWDTLLDPLLEPPQQTPPLPPVATRNFIASRMAVLKSDQWQAFVHYGQLTRAHAQAEIPAYELYAAGQPISIDPGTIGYGSPLHERYFRQSIAHNVVLVDGQGPAPEAWFPGSVDRFGTSPPEIEVSAPSYKTDVSVRRNVRLSGTAFYDRVDVQLIAPPASGRRIGLLFHTGCELKMDAMTAARFQASPAPVGAGFEFWTEVRAAPMPKNWTAALVCGGAQFSLNFSVGRTHVAYVASVPNTPLPLRRTAVYLETTAPAERFETRIAP